MMLDPAHVDAFVSHAPMLSESLQHVSANLVSAAGNAPAPPVSFLELAASKDYASLSPADATLQRMIGAVYVGPGSEQLQRTLSTFVNTPGIRQVLQLILPPLSVVATGALELALPSYMKVLDIVSKNGGHEGLLPEGIDVTLKAVQRLAAQGEILRAFKVLQAAWPTTSLRVGATVAVLVAFYVLTPPGVLFGLFDIYLVTPVDKAIETKWTGRDFTIGKQLGGGNFGTVFEATLTDFGAIKLRSKGNERVILKRIISDEEAIRKNFAKKTFFGTSLVGGTVARGNFETGKVESYFNERVRRYGFSGSFASYLGAFVGGIRMKEGDKNTVTVTSDQWLVWKFEGECTLESYLAVPNDVNFPYNIEYAVLKKTNDHLEDGRRQALIIKNIIWPILAALRDLHRVGIVHRDIKPANLLVNENTGVPIKLIDLGAAVDLRTGVNFNPETGLLDPKYAPPEQLVVPQEVPRAPPRFVALLGSPALWQLTSPDRFDTYSVGVLLLQLSVPEMRSGRQLDNFKSQLRSCGESLTRWREEYGDQYDLSLLDRKGGLAWNLAQQLVRPRNLLQRGRWSARQAMGHRYFWPEL
eukprot:CAMPEP_0173131598 /NCGR_PEP_ID=MMETSP1102-20130122/60728_1 /TAXON_ID=49646 /ORGANISM="Geminigera sp., Strain Caron Lab Isolate" /LENGTH=584 /DNA_ID=CAMNT_0014042929 /DNA_START=318 /DNA_END=2072 /DNA_ORIENTATION=-